MTSPASTGCLRPRSTRGDINVTRSPWAIPLAAAHPGWTAANLQANSPLIRALNPFVGMKPWQGALPTLYAAVAAESEQLVGLRAPALTRSSVRAAVNQS